MSTKELNKIEALKQMSLRDFLSGYKNNQVSVTPDELAEVLDRHLLNGGDIAEHIRTVRDIILDPEVITGMSDQSMDILSRSVRSSRLSFLVTPPEIVNSPESDFIRIGEALDYVAYESLTSTLTALVADRAGRSKNGHNS